MLSRYLDTGLNLPAFLGYLDKSLKLPVFPEYQDTTGLNFPVRPVYLDTGLNLIVLPGYLATSIPYNASWIPEYRFIPYTRVLLGYLDRVKLSSAPWVSGSRSKPSSASCLFRYRLKIPCFLNTWIQV